MQVSLSEKILSQLSGSNRVNPVVESQLLKLGRKADVVKELNNLDLRRKIVRCKVTKNGASNEVIYLSGQLVCPGELRLHNLSGGKAYKERSNNTKYCRGCKQDLPRQSFKENTRKCIECHLKKPVPKIYKQTGKERDASTRICIICKAPHPIIAFTGKTRMCLATKDHHASHKAKLHSAGQKRWREKCTANKTNNAGTGKTSSRKGVILSAETRAKMTSAQKARHQKLA